MTAGSPFGAAVAHRYLIVFRNGQEVKRVTGAYPKKRLEAEIAPALA